MARILLYGGSFNPVHHGHLICAAAAAEILRAERIVLIPSSRPPHKIDRALAPVDARLEMCRLAVQGDPRFEISDWEAQQPGPNYTLLTVRRFRDERPADELAWLLGADSLADLSTWFRVGELASECRLVTAVRPGFKEPDLTALAGKLSAEQFAQIRRDVLPTPEVNISATEIRERVRSGRPIRYLVSEAVCRYIDEQGLFAAG